MARLPELRYEKMVEDALRGVVREALAVVAERGLPGAHHFYITFRTDHPGVDIPTYLRAQYPLEMTIVLEHKFWGLEVDAEQFAVTLSFRNQSERLTVPLPAITAFSDPSVHFVLEFRADVDPEEFEAAPASLRPVAETTAPADVSAGIFGNAEKEAAAEKPAAEKAPEKAGEVVKLDAFRKK